MNKFDQVYALLAKHNQLHVLKHWNHLTSHQQDELCNQIISIDLNEPKSVESKQALIDLIDFNRNESNEQILSSTNIDQHELEGFRVIANSELAIITLAGGLSKRLSVSYPKGLYSVDLLSNKSLFQLHAERLVRIKQLAIRRFSNRNASIPWYIMTSDHTHSATIEFFQENNYFGLDTSDVIFFKQKMLPCFREHKLVLESKYKIKLAPNGTGGLYGALIRNSILTDMFKRNVKYVHVNGVENILLKIADPVFTGICVNSDSKLVAKIVDKTRYNEPINNLCYIHNKLSSLDFNFNSDLSTQIKFDTNSSQSILNLGDIVSYFVEFTHLKSLVKSNMRYYKFNARFTVLNDNGVEEKQRCDYYEAFLTSSFSDMKFLKVDRLDEYAPVEYMYSKNLFHTKTSCKKSLIDLHLSWLLRAGARFYYPETKELICTSRCDIQNLCEISPLVSYSGEELERYVKGKYFEPPLVLELDADTNQVTFNGLRFEDFDKAYPTNNREMIEQF